MAFVSIETQSLLAALDKLSQLNCTLGQTAFVDLDNTLRVKLDHIDSLLEKDLTPGVPPPPTEDRPPVERNVRVLPLTDPYKIKSLQIQAKFTQEWAAADNSGKAEAYENFQQARKALRNEIVLGWIAGDYRATTLIYANPLQRFPRGADVLTFPDGKSRQVISLIHFSHAQTPEELYLREKRIQAERVIHYRVPGLDCTEYERSMGVRSPITPAILRKVLCNS